MVSNMECTYIFDIDGVIVDCNERILVAMELAGDSIKKFWKYFFNEDLFRLDKPREVGIRLLIDRANKGKVVVISGRPKRLLGITKEQLRSFGVLKYIDRLCLRGNNDFRPSSIYKLEVIKRLINEGSYICEVHDDDEKFLLRLKETYPNIRTYLHIGRGDYVVR